MLPREYPSTRREKEWQKRIEWVGDRVRDGRRRDHGIVKVGASFHRNEVFPTAVGASRSKLPSHPFYPSTIVAHGRASNAFKRRETQLATFALT